MTAPDETKRIIKSLGLTRTEQFLSKLCENTFLKLWSYPNPFKEPGKELCDLIAVFENHMFLFFDREPKTFENDPVDIGLAWERWKKEAIAKQIKTARQARAHVLRSPDELYLDAKCETKFPVKLPTANMVVHTIIVAHGATEACKKLFPGNSSGSLAVIYTDDGSGLPPPVPFMVQLERIEPVHLLDSHTVETILGELDTFYDFTSYITAKEDAIARFKHIVYPGEEDLLADYYLNFDATEKKHFIGTQNAKYEGVFISDGRWQNFVGSETYKRKKLADRVSYLWDELLQRTTQNALDGTLLGDGGIYESQSAVFEMAKEPRFSRRALCEAMGNAIQKFPEDGGDAITRNMTFMPSFYPQTAYVFLQIRYPHAVEYDADYRSKRQSVLQVACGVAKNKFPQLTKIIGLAIDAPKFTNMNSEDFILLRCHEWPDEERVRYEELNKGFKFFKSASLKAEKKTVINFPAPENKTKPAKIGRNDPCPCGSGKKYKKCHGLFHAA